jgi:hypothetical protein
MSPIQRLEYMGKTEKLPRPHWIMDDMWGQCQHLEATLEPFALLCRSILNNHAQWENFYLAEDPYHLMETKYEALAQESSTEGKFGVNLASSGEKLTDSRHSV